jgi:hypothetical protein
MKKTTKKQAKEIAAWKRLSPAPCFPGRDFSDSDFRHSEVTGWPGAVVGRFYRPIKKPLTIG